MRKVWLFLGHNLLKQNITKEKIMSNTTKTPTPRTDDAIQFGYLLPVLCRQLETELAEAKATLSQARTVIKSICGQPPYQGWENAQGESIDRMINDVMSQGGETEFDRIKADLAKERARLDFAIEFVKDYFDLDSSNLDHFLKEK